MASLLKLKPQVKRCKIALSLKKMCNLSKEYKLKIKSWIKPGQRKFFNFTQRQKINYCSQYEALKSKLWTNDDGHLLLKDPDLCCS